MSEQRLEQVIEILSKYNGNQGVVDYYEIFGFNQNMTPEEIKAQIRKSRLQVLFHPDQIHFVPNEYHEKYLQMIEMVKDVINTFDNDRNKKNYDNKLEEEKKRKENNSQREDHYQQKQDYQSYNQNQSYRHNQSNNQSNYWENKTEDLEETMFQEAIIITANKHGFEFVRDSILQYVRSGSVTGFTRENNARGMVANIDRAKIMKLITQASIYDNPNDVRGYEQIVMNYLTDFVYNTPSLRQQADYLEQACINTIVKYDLNGRYGQTASALNQFYATGNADRFTNTNNGRVNLQNNVNHKDAKFFMQCSLNRQRHQDYRFAYQNTKQLENSDIVTMYSDDLISKVNDQYSGGEYNGGYGR